LEIAIEQRNIPLNFCAEFWINSRLGAAEPAVGHNPGLWKLVREGNFDAVICHTGYIRASFWITYLASKLSRPLVARPTAPTFAIPVFS
jgi:hypothetical protein